MPQPLGHREQKLPDDEGPLGVEQVSVGTEQPQEARKEEPEMRIFDLGIGRAELRQDLKVQDDDLADEGTGLTDLTINNELEGDCCGFESRASLIFFSRILFSGVHKNFAFKCLSQANLMVVFVGETLERKNNLKTFRKRIMSVFVKF